MALFLPRGHQRPNAILGRIGGHPQARNLVHWLPGIGSDPFTAGGAFNGAYTGVTDVTGTTKPKEAFDVFKVQTADMPGTVFYVPDTAYHQTAIVMVPLVAAFAGAASGGPGASLSVWVKLKLATPVDANYTGFCTVQGNGGTFPNSHYPYTDGTVYLQTLRNDRVSFTPSASVNRAQWHHIVITHTGYVWKCYQNAQLVYTDTTGDGQVYVSSGGASYCAFMGAWADGNYVMNGHSCDWRLYNRALSQAEILSMYAPATRWSLYYGV